MTERIDIKYAISEVSATVDLLAVHDQPGSAHICAYVVDTGSKAKEDKIISYAVGLAYKQKFNVPDEKYRGARAQNYVRDDNNPRAWYAFVFIEKKT